MNDPVGYSESVDFHLSKGGLAIPKVKTLMGVRLTGADGKVRKQWKQHNLITSVGEEYYALRAASDTETIPNTYFTNGATRVFDGVAELYQNSGVAPAKTGNRSNVGGTLIAGTAKAPESGYPRTNDPNTANPGRGVKVITYHFQWQATEAVSTNVTTIVITNPSPGATENLFIWTNFAENFAKQSGEVLDVWVNHQSFGALAG